METSKHLLKLLRKAGVDGKEVDMQIHQRAAYNMNNYLRLINFRLEQPNSSEHSRSDHIKNLLHFIHSRA